MKLFIRILGVAVAIVIGDWLLSGVMVEGWIAAIILAVVLLLLGWTIKPLVVLLTLPITILTLGLFYLVINTGVIVLADWLLEDFEVNNFWWALLFGIIVSILGGMFARDDRKKR